MYLYGASGHAKVIIDILDAQQINVDGMFDDDHTIDELMAIPVNHQWNGESPIIVSIGNNLARKQIVQKLNCDFARVYHPSAVVSPNSSIGEGTVVMQGSIIQSGARVGCHCIVNTGSSVDHECFIEVFSPKDKRSEVIYCPEKPDPLQNAFDVTKTFSELNYRPQYSYLDQLRDIKHEMETEPFALLWGTKDDYKE